MNVTHVIPYMHPSAGGPPVVVDRLCRELVTRGWSPRVITTDLLAECGTESWAAGYRHAYPVEVCRTSGFRGFAYSRETEKAVDRAVAQSDLVHLHTLWTHPTLAAARACRRLGVPYVVMPHGMLDPHSLMRKRLKKLAYGRLVEWKNLRRASGLLYTHREEQVLAEASCRGLSPGHIVPLGADDPPETPRERLRQEFFDRFPETRDRRIVLFLSRLHPKKGLDLLVPAFARLAQSCDDAHLVLVGSGVEAYVSNLNRQVDRHGIRRRVTMTGPLHGRDKWAAMAAGSVFALPSYQENFALVVVDALRVGLPVVLSRRVNIWSDVVSAGAGFTCELDPVQLSDTLAQAIANKEALHMAALQGIELATTTFSWRKSADAAESAYQSALAHAAGAPK